MKNLDLWRLLLAFPLIGIGLPDLMLLLTEPNYQVPVAHWLILLGLLALQALLLVVKRSGPGQSNGPKMA